MNKNDVENITKIKDELHHFNKLLASGVISKTTLIHQLSKLTQDMEEMIK